MFASAYFMPKIDLNASFERERIQKQSIIQAIRRGLFTHVRYLLENLNVDPNEIFEATSMQPSVMALLPVISNTNSQPIVLNLNLIINSISSCHGRTPLMFCANIQDETWAYSIAQNLIEKGAKVGLKDPNGLNALMYACIHGKKNLVSLYLNAPGDYNLLSVDNFGNTAMHIASLGHTESICKILNDMCLKYDINPLTDIPKNKLGHTPCDLCVLNGHKTCIENLNSVNEYFTIKRSKQTSTKINTTFKKDDSRLGTPSILSNETNSNSNSRLSSINSSMHYYHHSIFNVNCPSVLLERSEISFKTATSADKLKNDHNDIKQSSGRSNNISFRSHLPQPQSNNHTSTASSASTNLHQFSSSSNLNSSNSIEIYKTIYPYKEHQIKANAAIIKKPVKEDIKKLKPMVYELRPLTSSKSFIKSKNKLEEIKIKDEPKQSDESKNRLKSASIIKDYTMPQISDLKLVSFSSPEPLKKSKQFEESQLLEHSSNDPTTWRRSFNKIFDTFESQKSFSFRKSFQYTPSTIEDLTPVQANILINASLNNTVTSTASNAVNRRGSMMPRKSLSQNIPPTLGRRQSTLNTLVGIKLHMGNRKTSIVAN